MWHCAQKPSSSEPGRAVVESPERPARAPPPVSKREVQSLPANGFTWLRSVPSGGEGASQSPAVEVCLAARRKAARHPGSRQELDIIEPFHSAKILAWHVEQRPGLCGPSQASVKGGGKCRASATT